MRYRFIKTYIMLKSLFSMKHWRGHGIHSPFMYRFVREVVMNKKFCSSPKSLPVELGAYNLLKRDRRFLERLYGYLGYDNCIAAGNDGLANNTLCIAPLGVAAEKVEELTAYIDKSYDKCCVAILGVNKSHDRYKLCRRIIRERNCISVDIYRTYVFFFDSGMRKQYYKLRNRV